MAADLDPDQDGVQRRHRFYYNKKNPRTKTESSNPRSTTRSRKHVVFKEPIK